MHLLAEHLSGRYAFHDLLRAYAADRARDTDPQPARAAALGRVLDHYLHTASRAALALSPARELIALAPPSRGTVAEQPAGPPQALAWFEAEQQVLLAAVTLADSSRFDAHAWHLPWAMMPFLDNRGHYQEQAAAQRTALAAATRAADTAGQAVSARMLAYACAELGDYDQAVGHYDSSLRLYRQLGDRHGEARAHHNLGVLAESQGSYADALGHAQQALRLPRPAARPCPARAWQSGCATPVTSSGPAASSTRTAAWPTPGRTRWSTCPPRAGAACRRWAGVRPACNGDFGVPKRSPTKPEVSIGKATSWSSAQESSSSAVRRSAYPW